MDLFAARNHCAFSKMVLLSIFILINTMNWSGVGAHSLPALCLQTAKPTKSTKSTWRDLTPSINSNSSVWRIWINIVTNLPAINLGINLRINFGTNFELTLESTALIISSYTLKMYRSGARIQLHNLCDRWR